MERCRFCEGLVIQVRYDLFKCVGTCGQYFRGGSSAPLYRYVVVSRAEELRDLTTKAAGEVFSLSDGQWKLVRAVSERLSHDLKMQKHYRDGFVDVFAGKTTFEDWLEKTKVESGLKEVELYEIVYDEMGKIPEILMDKDARAMRDQFKLQIAALRKYYPR